MEESTARKRLGIGALLITLVFLIGTGGYYILWQGKYPLLQCFYMTVVTVSTVGYREVLPISKDPTAMAFTIGLILVGMGTLMYFAMALASMLIEGRLADFFRRKRMESKIAKLKGHVIVCGAGNTGAYVVERLSEEGRVCVVIDKDEKLLEPYIKRSDNKIFVIPGDGTQESVLEAAGITRASGLVAALASDQDNLYLTLTAKSMNPDLRIVSKATSREAVRKFIRVGADRVISPPLIGGFRMYLEVVAPVVSDFLDALLYERNTNLTIGEMRIAPGSALVGVALRDTDLRARNILVLGYKEPETGKFIYAPDSSTILKENMTLIVLGDPEVIKAGL